jgi:ubiquinone/menaquinone biosynthesis C-methylase UbiE
MRNSKIDYDRAFWKMRAKHYNELEWVNHRTYLDAFIQLGDFRRSDLVLDVGTGTGVVAHAISPVVKQVIGLDKSQDMMEHSNWYGNMYFIRRDIRNPIFAGGVFDKVVCRQVFHHVLRDRQKAMNECYWVLKKGGRMVFSEGVPPTKRVEEDYTEIFRLKEKRVTFCEETLFGLMAQAGFILWLKKMSVKNWLINSGLPKSIQDKIFRLHRDAKSYFKEDYNMIETADDCFINMKMVILVGEKV